MTRREQVYFCALHQGVSRAAVQQLLGSRDLAEAAHEAVQPFARAVPALALRPPDLAAALRRAAAALHFVARCRTRIVVRRGGAEGARPHPPVRVSKPYPLHGACTARMTCFVRALLRPGEPSLWLPSCQSYPALARVGITVSALHRLTPCAGSFSQAASGPDRPYSRSYPFAIAVGDCAVLTVVLVQVYEFTDASGGIYIAEPPPGGALERAAGAGAEPRAGQPRAAAAGRAAGLPGRAAARAAGGARAPGARR